MNRESEKFLASGEGMLKFFRRMFESGVSLGELMRVVNHGDQLARAAGYIKAGCPEIKFVDGKQVDCSSASVETSQFMTVDPDFTFEEHIKLGNYDCDLTEMERDFPVTADQLGEWEWKLFHFDWCISSEEAIWLMKEDGYDAGQIGHILTFREINPEEQRKYPIIGLGSVAKLGLYLIVPALRDNHGGRCKLDVGWFGGAWGNYDRFLGVRRRLVA